MSDTFNLKDIGSLLELLDKHEVSEFKLERANETLWLKRGESNAQQSMSNVPIHQVFTSMPHHTAGGHSHMTEQQFANYSAGVGFSGTGQTGFSAPTAASAASEAAELELKKNSKIKEVISPMVGTFYRRPSADADPYVQVGDKIKKGDVLCIVEAMKLMNEIEAEFAGVVTEVCLDDGQMVEYGEALFRIEPV